MNGFSGVEKIEIDLGPIMYGILVGGIVMKLLLWFLCEWVGKHGEHSETLAALAEDHLNDGATSLPSAPERWCMYLCAHKQRCFLYYYCITSMRLVEYW